MKKVMLLLLFIVLCPSAFAEITIKTSQSIYNLGNGIGASASVLRGNSFEGLFKLAIECGDYKLDYFLIPISLEPDFVTAINIPDITASKLMIGKCNLVGAITSDSQTVDQSNSNEFKVTDKLSILPVQSKITAFPSDSIQMTGIVNEAFGNNVLKATTVITLGNMSTTIDTIDGKFNATIKIPKNIKSGLHSIEINAADAKNNLGSAFVELYITPVPNYLKIELSESSIMPGTKVSITSTIFDQADDIINDSLSLELTSPKNNKIFTKTLQSSENIEYEFSQYAEPGIYELVASYRNLAAQTSLNVTKIREIRIKYYNESVSVENIGNVVFEDELTFVLEGVSKKYPLTRKVKIEPGKTLILDLSKEVPYGVYDILVPIKEGIDVITDNINKTFGSLIEEGLNISGFSTGEKDILADGVVIHDNRPVYKKFAGRLASVSTFLVGADGILTKNPIIAPMLILVILVLIFIRYGGKPLLRLMRRRKKDEKEDKK